MTQKTEAEYALVGDDIDKCAVISFAKLGEKLELFLGKSKHDIQNNFFGGGKKKYLPIFFIHIGGHLASGRFGLHSLLDILPLG